jgi:hypothetical protein
VPEAHFHNPGYLRGRDQEDHSQSQPGKEFARPYLNKTHHKKGLVEWLKVKALSSNPSTTKKKKKSQRQTIRS